MALLHYRVLEADVNKDGTVSLPERSTVVAVKYRIPSGTPFLVLLMELADWVEEFPEEAKKEAKLAVTEKVKEESPSSVKSGETKEKETANVQ